MGNKYTTSTNVLEEIPGSVPEALTTQKIEGYIEDASRFVDARLPNYAGFADTGGNPQTPKLIEKIARMLAAYDCMVFMGEMRGDEHAGTELRTIAEKMLDDLSPTDGSDPRAMIPAGEYDYSQTPTKETARLTDSSIPHSIYRADLGRSDRRGGEVED